MIEKLKRKFNLLFLAGMVPLITAVVLLFLWNSTNQLLFTQEMMFRNVWNGVIDEWESYPQLDESIINNLERDGMAVQISDSQDVLLASRLSLSTPIDVLIEDLYQYSPSSLSIGQSDGDNLARLQTINTALRGRQGERFMGATAYDAGNDRTLYLFYPVPEILALMGKSVRLYPVAWVVAVIIILLLSRQLVRHAVTPIAQSIESQKAFISAASHELKSPLTVISSHAQELSQDATAMIIQKECARMSRLISDMLMLAATDSGNWGVQKELFSLENVLIEGYDKHAVIAKNKGITLELHLPEHTHLQMVGDRERIAQVLDILLDNAISYAFQNTTVLIKAAEQKNAIKLSVIDHGPGIPGEDKAHVFERFYRADASRTQKEHFGLGLSIAKEIVRLHDGRIAVLDTPGGGCTVEVVFH